MSTKIKYFLLGVFVLGPFLLLVTFLAHHLVYWNKIYPWVKIAGITVGNQTKETVTDILNQAINQSKPAAINLRLDDNFYSWPIQKFDLHYLPEKTAAKALNLGRQSNWQTNLQTKWQVWHQQIYLELDYYIDWFALENQVASLAAQLETPPQPPAISINQQQIEVFRGKNGRQINQGLILNQIETQLGQLQNSQITIPVEEIKVEISEATATTIKMRASKFINQEIRWQTPEQNGILTDADLINLLDFNQGFDREKTNQLVELLAQRIEQPSANAVFEFSQNRVQVFQPAKPGIDLDQPTTHERILIALQTLEAGEQPEPIDLPINYIEPEIKTADINDLGIKELIGQGRSTFWHSITSRIHNIKITAEKINGRLVKPDEIFSFSQAVGDISQENGYQSAYIIKDGKTILGDGGGVCQVSTTMFRAALDAGLPIIERRAHSYRVGYYEQNSQPGFDATVYAPNPDFKFKNDTQYHLLIQTHFDAANQRLIINLYGADDGRVAEISQARVWDQQPPPEDLYIDDPALPIGTIKQIDWQAWGAKAAFDWLVTRNGETLQQKTFYSVYKPWQAIYLRGTMPL
ncbi:VanW family protein [Patescibacteria group bacterium]|nr:VanW family protein [Patescibacteria group bacterium]